MIGMARSVFILDDAPDGPKRSYNGVRLAAALFKREGFEGRARPVAALCRQRVSA